VFLTKTNWEILGIFLFFWFKIFLLFFLFFEKRSPNFSISQNWVKKKKKKNPAHPTQNTLKKRKKGR
jgi:hypothetical protein